MVCPVLALVRRVARSRLGIRLELDTRIAATEAESAGI